MTRRREFSAAMAPLISSELRLAIDMGWRRGLSPESLGESNQG
jgi:hypothetical protein